MGNSIFDFRGWLEQQESNDYQTIRKDEDHYQLKTDYALAEINFYHVEPDPDIVEFRITNLKDEEVKFFLHFALHEEKHAHELYAEMTDTLRKLKTQQKKKVLLSCTAGLTTGYFAQRLNQAAEVLSADFEFSAVPVNQLYENGFSYDAILLAPQVGYQFNEIQKVFTDRPVIRMPSQIFGRYDTGGCIQMVMQEIENFRKEKEEDAFFNDILVSKNDKRILIIAMMPSGESSVMKYRIYDHGKTGEAFEVKKSFITMKDIEDVIDTQSSTCRCTSKKIDAVGIATPGVINDGCLDLPSTDTINLQVDKLNNSNVVQYLHEKYNLPIVVTNNLNASVVGYYGQQDQYETITLHSQPVNWPRGGQGIVVDGKLQEGRHHITGEVKYLVDQFVWSSNIEVLAANPEGMMEIVSKCLLANIVTVDPEVILVRCALTPDMDAMHKELEKYLPSQLIPDLIHIKDISEYMLAGQLRVTLDKIAE